MTSIELDSWKHGLRKSGEYYEGVVSSVDDCLEAHKRETVTTWGTRTSSSTSAPADNGTNATVSTILILTRHYH